MDTSQIPKEVMIGDIKYSIVALRLSDVETTDIVLEATGLQVNSKAADFLQNLDNGQLEVIRKRLLEHGDWKNQESAKRQCQGC